MTHQPTPPDERDQIVRNMATVMADAQWLKKHPGTVPPMWFVVAAGPNFTDRSDDEAYHFWRKAVISAEALADAGYRKPLPASAQPVEGEVSAAMKSAKDILSSPSGYRHDDVLRVAREVIQLSEEYKNAAFWTQRLAESGDAVVDVMLEWKARAETAEAALAQATALPVDSVYEIIGRVRKWAKTNTTRPLAWKACCEEITARLKDAVKSASVADTDKRGQ